MNLTAGIILNGKLLNKTFPEGIIKAGQWAYSQGYNSEEYQVILLMPDGTINHRAIIQVYDYLTGKIILENHYTTCGTFHFPMEKYEEHKKYFENKYNSKTYKVTAWIEY
jgi:hypothetical protein